MGRTLLAQSLAALTLTVFVFLGTAEAEKKHLNATGNRRTGKLFSIFQVIRFPNDGCTATGNTSGTCYTAEECTQKGGSNGGACAQGYGICCIFSFSCGATTRQNCSFFTSTNAPSTGICQLTVCKANSNICQIRLDFNSFSINGPSTSTDSVGKIVNGQLNGPSTAGVKVTDASECLIDSFSLTNPGGNAPPVICGLNNMEHMYVAASDACNDLAFQLGTATVTRQWNIKVTQFSCDFSNLAPPGCVQYFFGSGGSQTVRTYNFNGGQHLANQYQSICIRREAQFCRICWAATAAIDFAVSGQKAVASGFDNPVKCCQYPALSSSGYDCIEIPGASKFTALGNRVGTRICGRSAGLITIPAMVSAIGRVTVCSTQTPFLLTFYSDNFEYLAETNNAGAPTPQKGFRLTYKQISTNC